MAKKVTNKVIQQAESTGTLSVGTEIDINEMDLEQMKAALVKGNKLIDEYLTKMPKAERNKVAKRYILMAGPMANI